MLEKARPFIPGMRPNNLPRSKQRNDQLDRVNRRWSRWLRSRYNVYDSTPDRTEQRSLQSYLLVAQYAIDAAARQEMQQEVRDTQKRRRILLDKWRNMYQRIAWFRR